MHRVLARLERDVGRRAREPLALGLAEIATRAISSAVTIGGVPRDPARGQRYLPTIRDAAWNTKYAYNISEE